MTEFLREIRYVVVKLSRITNEQLAALHECVMDNGIPTVECVVVESDWPEYEPVWKMINDRVSGEQP